MMLAEATQLLRSDTIDFFTVESMTIEQATLRQLLRHSSTSALTRLMKVWPVARMPLWNTRTQDLC